MSTNRSVLLLIILFFSIPVPAQKKELTLETMFTDRALYGRGVSGVQWFDNDNKYSFLKMDPSTRSVAVFQHDVKSGNESVLVTKNDILPGDEGKDFMIQNYQWSPDEKNILFTGLLPARTTKSGGDFYIYNLETKKTVIISSEEEQANAGFSPDGRMLGYVKNNNIYFADISTGSVKQLTFDGSDVILNGIFDWVYEEEFSIIKGWEWSPDSKRIAYWRLDQSPEPRIEIARWDSLYLNFDEMRYPKPGARNAIVKIGVVNIADAKTTWMDIGDDIDIYIPRINFTKDPGLLSIQRLNRLQNKVDFIMADVKSGKSNLIFTDKSDEWIDIYDDLTFLPDGKTFVWTSEEDGFKHIYLYDYSGKKLKQLTKGNWAVENILAANDNKIYFTGNERGVRYTDMYSVEKDGSDFTRITEEPGTHSITMSKFARYYIDRYSTASRISSTILYNNKGEKIADLVVSDQKVLDDYGFTPVEFFSFKTSEGTELNASMIKPWNFDENKKYPVIFDIYGGPGSEPAKDRWGSFGYLWQQILAKNGFIIITVDNRGTDGRGTAFKHVVYKRLGTIEVNDYIETAKYLATLKYVDPSRIGITGGSYGGYMAALAITKASDYFKTAIAVSSVIDWKFYDTIYTERYMQTPETNPEGYRESSVLTYTDRYKGNLLIIHGTEDDNVHLQNSITLIEKLISEGKKFDMMLYPGKKHGIYGGGATQHYYNLMLDYFLKNL